MLPEILTIQTSKSHQDYSSTLYLKHKKSQSSQNEHLASEEGDELCMIMNFMQIKVNQGLPWFFNR